MISLAVWPFSWVIDLPGALPPEHISETKYPKTFAFVRRFESFLKSLPNCKTGLVTGQEAVDFLASADFAESGTTVDSNDPSLPVLCRSTLRYDDPTTRSETSRNTT